MTAERSDSAKKFYSLFANAMEEKRKSGVSYKSLGEKLDIPHQILYRWEWGIKPNFYHALLVCKELKIELNELLFLSEGENEND